MSEILIIWLSALVSQMMAPYLIFILLQKSTHSVNMVVYSQNARLCRNCVLIRPTIKQKRKYKLGKQLITHKDVVNKERKMATGTEYDGSMDELPPQQGQGATARQQSEIRTEQITATGNHTNQKILSPSQYFANL